MRVLVSIAMAGLVGIVLVLALAPLPGAAQPQQPPPAETQEQAAAAAVPQAIPEAARSLVNPVRATRESIEHGGLLFSSQCTMCHGAKGDGKGDLVERLRLTMPDLTDASVQAKWTDGELFYVLTEGHGRMPGHKTRFDDETKWDMINYVRTLAPRR